MVKPVPILDRPEGRPQLEASCLDCGVLFQSSIAPKDDRNGTAVRTCSNFLGFQSSIAPKDDRNLVADWQRKADQMFQSSIAPKDDRNLGF